MTSSSSSIQRQLRYQHALERATSFSSSIQRQLRYQHTLAHDKGTQMAEALGDVIFNPATTPLPTHLGARHRDTDGTCDLALVSPRTAPLLSIETTHKGVNQRSKDVTQVQQQRPESATVTLTRYACKYKVHKLHQRYIPFCFFFFKKKCIYIKNGDRDRHTQRD